MHKPFRLTGQHVHFSPVDVFAHEPLNGNPLARSHRVMHEMIGFAWGSFAHEAGRRVNR